MRSFDLPLDYLPRLPRRRDWRIGCAGAGFIMNDCHLVAYRKAGFNPVAIASRDPAKAKTVAAARGVARAHASLDELLADSSIEVLDVAVPPDTQPALIRARSVAANRGKDFLTLSKTPQASGIITTSQARARASGDVFISGRLMR